MERIMDNIQYLYKICMITHLIIIYSKAKSYYNFDFGFKKVSYTELKIVNANLKQRLYVLLSEVKGRLSWIFIELSRSNCRPY